MRKIYDKCPYCQGENRCVRHEATPLLKRFLEKVIKADGCWDWSGSKNIQGYGQIRQGPKGRLLLASRVSFELFKGTIPDGMCVLHECDTPARTNPDHLFLGTKADNSTDMVRKGRSNRGDRNGNNKLYSVDVDIIRALIRQGLSQKKIAKRFNVDQPLISKINRGHIWT